MDVNGVNVTRTLPILPDPVVEKILAMMPFPSLYKARCLAKAWDDRFKPISSQSGAKKALAAYFQERVLEQSPKWDTFCPILIAYNDAFAYHRATQSGKGMPSLSFLPGHIYTTNMDLQMEGALLLAPTRRGVESMYVANILTRTYKQLPLSPYYSLPNDSPCSDFAFCVKLVINSSLQTYSVIRFCQDLGQACATPNCDRCNSRPNRFAGVRMCLVQVYDSQSGIWTSRSVTVPTDSRPFNDNVDSVYLDGIIYMLETRMENDAILAYNIELGRFTRFIMLTPVRNSCFWTSMGLLVCDSGLLAASARWHRLHGLGLMVVDTGLSPVRLYTELWLPYDPWLPKTYRFFMKPLADRNCVFFPSTDTSGSTEVATYDLSLKEWSSFSVDDAVMEGKVRDRHNERGDPLRHYLPQPFRIWKYFKGPSWSFQPGATPFIEL